ncbi:MAG TPA: hypothetical protein VF297_29360 [Pyrinomonadaceae bacterium]
MAKGNPGADSSQPVTAELINTATQQFGQAPLFWGRYFTSPTATGTVEYHHGTESPVLAQHNIRLLPVARQTGHVGGSQQQGTSDAQQNVQDFLDTFSQDYLVSQGGQFLLFLDVEGSPSTGSPSLSLDYYLGWARTLVSYSQSQTGGAVTILPCVYARQGDNETWDVLVSANGQGATCNGAWVARYYYSGCDMHDWNDSVVMPSVALPFDVLLWQYAENCCGGTIDCNQTNPNLDTNTLLLDRLILPAS